MNWCDETLEVWVAEDSPFYRLVVEDALEEIARVTDLHLYLRVFEKLGDIQSALLKAQSGEGALPVAVLSDLHFPDSTPSDLDALFEFYERHCAEIPISYMSCNSTSLLIAQRRSSQSGLALVALRFLRKDTNQTNEHLIKALHAMLFTPRAFIFNAAVHS